MTINHRKYSIGSTGEVSAGEVEERGGIYGYRVGEGEEDPSNSRRTNGGRSPFNNLADGKGGNPRYRVGGDLATPMAKRNSISDDPSLVQMASNRFRDFREHRPFIRWGTLSDTEYSTYETYVAGKPSVRGQRGQESAQCTCLCNGPYFAPGPRNWADYFHAGGKKGGGSPEIRHPTREVATELGETMRTAMHLWCLSNHLQYDDRYSPDLFLESDTVYCARRRMDFAREMNAEESRHLPNRGKRGEYRSMLREGEVRRGVQTGRCFRHACEFNMTHGELRDEICGKNDCEPFRAPCPNPSVRISDGEEKRLEDLRDLLRG